MLSLAPLEAAFNTFRSALAPELDVRHQPHETISGWSTRVQRTGEPPKLGATMTHVEAVKLGHQGSTKEEPCLHKLSSHVITRAHPKRSPFFESVFLEAAHHTLPGTGLA